MQAMSKLIRGFILLAFMGMSLEGECQIFADGIKDGLKGNVATVKTNTYDLYLKTIDNRFVSAFDRQGYIINRVDADSVKLPAYIWKFKYDIKKNLLKLIKSKNGNILSVYTNIYNARGYLSQQNLTTTEQTYFKPVSYFFKYDNKGRLTEVRNEEYGIDIRPSTNVFTYDAKGLRITNEKYDRFGNLESKSFFSYNWNGDIIKKIYYPDVMSSDKSSTFIYSYTYDKRGNWLTKNVTDYKSNKPELLQQRQITYY
jgi:hypothetical protein